MFYPVKIEFNVLWKDNDIVECFVLHITQSSLHNLHVPFSLKRSIVIRREEMAPHDTSPRSFMLLSSINICHM